MTVSADKERPSLIKGPSRLGRKAHRVWSIFRLAVKQFMRIDGAERAAAFAFNAFFALFPLMILLVTVASFFVDRDKAGKEVLAYMAGYVPISGEMQRHVFRTIAGVMQARRQAGAVSLLILTWSALQCFISLICTTDRAWNSEPPNWWRLPVKSLVLLAITASTIFLGVAVSVLAKIANGWFVPRSDLILVVYALGSFFAPLLLIFLSLSLFYRVAPRRPTRFAEVWSAAMCATVLLQAAGSLFVIYLKNFAALNAVYGTLGGIMALLLWIYLSGCILIFGACLCAAQAEGSSMLAPPNDVSSFPRRPRYD